MPCYGEMNQDEPERMSSLLVSKIDLLGGQKPGVRVDKMSPWRWKGL